MKSIVVVVNWFSRAADRKADQLSMGKALDLLVELNEDFLRKLGYAPGKRPSDPEKRIPGIYNAGLHYARDPPGIELWQTIPALYQSGCGDCEDLAAARVAELRLRCGEPAKIGYRGRVLPNGHLLFHILVKRADGRIEDPSRVLGMV